MMLLLPALLALLQESGFPAETQDPVPVASTTGDQAEPEQPVSLVPS